MFLRLLDRVVRLLRLALVDPTVPTRINEPNTEFSRRHHTRRSPCSRPPSTVQISLLSNTGSYRCCSSFGGWIRRSGKEIE